MIQGLDLQEVCNIIILVSAVIIAVKNIYGFFRKPVDSLQDHAKRAEQEHIEEVIKQRMPDLLKVHANSVREERKKEMEEMVSSLRKMFLENLDDKIEELKEINLDQGRQIDMIQASVNQLNNSQMDMMRYNMNQLYYRYRPFKKILDCDKKAFIKLYNDYHAMGGNTWIDELYKEVLTWEIVEDESELK